MNNNLLKDIPVKPKPHPIFQLVKQGSISIYQLSLRLDKSYSHTRNLIAGFSDPTPETKKILDDLFNNLGDQQ